MSWLSNPFKILQIDEKTHQNDPVSPQNDVKDDFTAIGERIGRQVRAFLGPESSNSGQNKSGFVGIKSDLEEIKGTFKNSILMLSSNSGSEFSKFSKFASNLISFDDGDGDVDVGYVNSMIIKVNHDDDHHDDHDDGDDDHDHDHDDGGDGDGDDDVGVDDEVVEFAEQICKRPEIWTEFPLELDYEFDLSQAQYEHVSVIEQLVPSLADIKSKISSDKSEKQFWMIYFILLLPRLNEEDAELLSTPETVEARETLLKMLQAKKNEGTDSENPQLDSDNEVHKASIKSNEANQSDIKPENDNVVEEKHVISESSGVGASKRHQSEDDVSFSDLEDDDSDLSNRRSRSGPTQSTRTSSPEGSNDWVRLNKNVEDRGNKVKGQSSQRERDSEGEDSTGWLTVDDFDP